MKITILTIIIAIKININILINNIKSYFDLKNDLIKI